MNTLNYKNLPDNTILSLIAPTASGKTDLAFKLFDTGRFELISVDSALIYQGMNIGTAKPTKDELTNYPHYLVDIITPLQSYDVAQFVADVEVLIDKIHQNGKIPVLVGGTMMYYMALFDGISDVPKTLPYIRQEVAEFYQKFGNVGLYEFLQKNDPTICQKLKPSDTQRLSRAVEVFIQTGVPLSIHQTRQKQALSHNPSQAWYALCVNPDRAWLHERIAKRLDIMWQNGLVDEVLDLLDCHPDLHPDLPSMRCVGYRQVLEYLISNEHSAITSHQGVQNYMNNTKNRPIGNKITCNEMQNRALYATRQLAKRQTTWLRQIGRLSTPTPQNQTPRTNNNIQVSEFSSIQQVEQQLLGL